MGCHTWFYRKVERTQEEANQRAINSIKGTRRLYWKLYRNINYLGVDWGINRDRCRSIAEACNRKIRMVNKGLCQRAVWDRQDDKKLTEYVDGKGLFIEDTGYHDVFRKYGYPDDKLFSFQETLDYLNDPDNECSLNNSSIDKLKEFWDKYPEGMIEFG